MGGHGITKSEYSCLMRSQFSSNRKCNATPTTKWYDGHTLNTIFQLLNRSLYIYICQQSEMLTTSELKSTIFWDMRPCSPLKVNRRFGGSYSLHFKGPRIRRGRNQREKKVGSRLCYGLDGWGSIPGKGKTFLFSTTSRPALGPSQSTVQWVPGALSLRVQRSESEAHHHSEVTNGGAIPPLPPDVFMT
jgi:hypothetical protein